MSRLASALEEALASLEEAGLRRTLEEPAGIDFSSNDYLGFSSSPEFRRRVVDRIRQGPLSAPASRLLRGNLPEHAALEKRLARFKGTESALIFSSGYQANVGVLSSLAGPRDRILSDELNHASIIDGVRLSGAEKVIFPHLDAAAVEEHLASPHAGGRTFLVTESYFSMDGDIAPLDEYARLAGKFGASLIVDDAHATGIYGDGRGSGLVEAFAVAPHCDAVVSTFGKGLGGFGAFVGGPRAVIEWLVNRARSFIFSTAPPPVVLWMMEAGVALAASSPDRRKRVHRLAERLRRKLRAAKLDCLRSRGPIIPVVIGDNRDALEVARRLQERGFDVRAIRPPSVASGTARLRISVHADHIEEVLDRLAKEIVEAVSAVRTAP